MGEKNQDPENEVINLSFTEFRDLSQKSEFKDRFELTCAVLLDAFILWEASLSQKKKKNASEIRFIIKFNIISEIRVKIPRLKSEFWVYRVLKFQSHFPDQTQNFKIKVRTTIVKP